MNDVCTNFWCFFNTPEGHPDVERYFPRRCENAGEGFPESCAIRQRWDEVQRIIEVKNIEHEAVTPSQQKEKKMRKINIGTSKHTVVYATDEPEFNANHKYQVRDIARVAGSFPALYADISFQKGPIKESGVNGCHNEDLIAIVIDRLQSLNQGNFACRENSIAITKLEEAMLWLRKRTMDREARGVEGTSEV